MVISITPHSRDNFNDLSTLTIKHNNGIIDTPNRLVNRYDLNAKDQIGADIPLTRASKSFMIQESINPEKLNDVLTKNGYLGELLTKIKPITNRVETSDSLKFLYPSLTAESFSQLDTEKKKFDYVRFFCNLAKQLNLESITLPVIDNVAKMNMRVTNFGLQFIPTLDLKIDTQIFEKQLDECRQIGSHEIPIISLKFAQYPKANKTYDLIMDNFDHIHEDAQAIMMVDAPRALYSSEELNVSALHYGSFITADLIVESYTGGGGVNINKKVRLFCKNDLITQVLQPKDNKFDVEQEKQVFPNDKKLQELLEKIAKNSLTEQDWKNNRPKYLSRAHENVRTRTEFKNLHKNIESNSTKDYLKEKRDMNSIVIKHLEPRFQTKLD